MTKLLNELDAIESKPIDNIGWIDIDRTKLSYGGRLYPSTWQFKVRPATVAEIRHFSSLDEENPISVSSAMYDMIMSNVRITDGNKIVKSDRIYEYDQLYFLLLIHEYTGGTKSIVIEHVCQSCNTKNTVKLTSDKLQYEPLSEVAEKYLTNNGTFEVKTKSFGTLTYKPIMLKDSVKLREYMIDCHNNNRKFETMFTRMFPFLRTKDEYDAKELYQHYLALSKEKYGAIFNLVNKHFQIKALTTLNESCEQCESGIQPYIQFGTGLANIFIDDNVDGELL